VIEIGYSLSDSRSGGASSARNSDPAARQGPAGDHGGRFRRCDHDTDSYEKIARAFLGGHPAGGLTRDRILDNITLYWLTGSATSAARLYWEGARAATQVAGQQAPEVSLPAAFTVFPDEVFKAPRNWVEQVYPNLVYFNEVDRVGHFAAWEQPELFTNGLRAAFRSLR